MRQIDMTSEFFAMHTAEDLSKTNLNFNFTGKEMAKVWNYL